MRAGGIAAIAPPGSSRSLRPRLWHLFAVGAVLAGCRYPALPEIVGDGSIASGGSDAASGAIDAANGAGNDAPVNSPTSTCIQHWIDGNVTLSAPQLLPGFATSGTDDRDPWISDDGLQLYFNRGPGAHGGFDLYVATRNRVSDDFANPAGLDNVNTASDEIRPALSGDGLTLVFASNQSAGGAKIFITTRADTTQPFPSPSANAQNLLAIVNTSPAGTRFFDPFLSRDGLRLYLAPITGNTPQYLAMASRSSAGAQFTASSATVFANVSSTSGNADPGLSADERVLVYSSPRGDPTGMSSGSNLWYATRQLASDPFQTPHIMPVVNGIGASDDGDPVLSADGCALYFASTRAVSGIPGAQYHLYKAVVQP